MFVACLLQSNTDETISQHYISNFFNLSQLVSNRVQKIIEESGLSDTELSDRLNVSRTTVWRWRNGKVSEFSINQLRSIANELGCNYNWLRSGSGDMRAEEEPSVDEKADRVRELMGEYESRKAVRPPSETEREILLEFLQQQAEALSKGLRRLHDLNRAGVDRSNSDSSS